MELLLFSAGLKDEENNTEGFGVSPRLHGGCSASFLFFCHLNFLKEPVRCNEPVFPSLVLIRRFGTLSEVGE